MDYDEGDWTICVENEGWEHLFTRGSKYACELLYEGVIWPLYPNKSVEIPAWVVKMAGIPNHVSADSFRKYNPPAPDQITKHTERPKAVTR